MNHPEPENIKSNIPEELKDISDQKTAPLLDPVQKKQETDNKNDEVDLSDPNAYELMLDEHPEDDTKLQNAQKRLLSLDISNQKGVSLRGNYIILPGRVSLLLITLSLILFTVIGLSFGFIHFSALSPNYLLAFAILQIILFIQITLYHSAYRAQRTTVSVIVTLVTILVITIVDIFFFDLVFHPRKENSPFGLLLLTTISFTAVPVLMFSHLVFLGRGTRTVAIKRKKSDDVPTEILPAVTPEKDIPTEIMNIVESEKDIPTDVMPAVEVKKIDK